MKSEVKKLDWENLKFKRCPKCGGKLKFDFNIDRVICAFNECSFSISKPRMDEILSNLHNRAVDNLYMQR